MGGNAGGIIVRRLRETLADPLVKGKVPTNLRAHLDAILNKDEGDCDHSDVRYMSYCLVEAHSDC